jgi:hypothetical protein
VVVFGGFDSGGGRRRRPLRNASIRKIGIPDVARALLLKVRAGGPGRRQRAMRGRAAFPFLILAVLITAIRLGASKADCCDARADGLPPAWVVRLTSVDTAVGAGDAARADRDWADAWRSAVALRRWDALLAAGDAAIRVGELGDRRSAGQARARLAYQAALFRAYDQRSVEGVLRAAEAMIALGDREAPAAAVRMAHRLATAIDDAEVRGEAERAILRVAGGVASGAQATR